MGEKNVKVMHNSHELRSLMRQLLIDVQAFEILLQEGLIESDVSRVGAEQEVFLIDSTYRPALTATEILDKINDPYYTTELGRFNLEMNLDPHEFTGDCLNKIESQINELLERLRSAADELDTKILLTGILPTLNKADLSLENMTPNPRYFALNSALEKLRDGKPYNFYIKGIDELNIQHKSVMVEACNTSFQVHFQVSHENFAHYYNIAQATAGPILAAATNSPLLFGRRLWQETRIALFQQAVDTRSATPHQRVLRPRVSFGDHWIEHSALEIFQEDIARFRVLLGTELDEDPLQMIRDGKTPKLKALQLHNGTVYRWNRACYGISNGKPHLRIENRVLPSGPSVVDEVANAAFWFGMISGLAEKYEDIRKVQDFDDVKENFQAAAHLGLNAQFTWMDKKIYPAQKLICEHLLPLASDSLHKAGINQKDIERYLGIIDKRVSSGQTGSQWILKSLARLKNKGNITEQLSSITAAIYTRQNNGNPVHEWKLAKIKEAGGWRQSYLRVEQYMDTDLFTVNQDELIDLVANLMIWKQTRQVLVEDNQHRLVGIVSHRTLLRLIGKELPDKEGQYASVSSIMYKDPITISPETPTLEAIAIMRREGVSSLPVIKNDRLVGLVTEKHFMGIARQLLERQLKEVPAQ